MCLNCNNICDIVIENENKVFILPNKEKNAIVLDLFKWNYEVINELNIDVSAGFYLCFVHHNN